MSHANCTNRHMYNICGDMCTHGIIRLKIMHTGFVSNQSFYEQTIGCGMGVGATMKAKVV